MFPKISEKVKARTQPKIYGNGEGGMPIFPNLYLYIFVLMKIILIICGRIMCEKDEKVKKSTIFCAHLI